MAIERIVVASDRSETATRAVSWAAEMASATGGADHRPGVRAGTSAGGSRTELAVYAEQIAGPSARARVGADDHPAERDRRRRRGREARTCSSSGTPA